LDFFSTTAAVVAVVGLILRFELRIFFNVRGGGVCVLDSFTSLVVVAVAFFSFLLVVFVSFIFAALLFFNTGAAFVVFVDFAFVDFDFVCLLLLAQGLMDRSENAMMKLV
jgi:hypothetical protein